MTYFLECCAACQESVWSGLPCPKNDNDNDDNDDKVNNTIVIISVADPFHFDTEKQHYQKNMAVLLLYLVRSKKLIYVLYYDIFSMLLGCFFVLKQDHRVFNNTDSSPTV